MIVQVVLALVIFRSFPKNMKFVIGIFTVTLLRSYSRIIFYMATDL